MKIMSFVLVLGTCLSISGFAQQEKIPAEKMALDSIGRLRFMSAEYGVEGRVVKGAPYSADAVTQHTQTLADGNRIANTSTTSVARDSEGRIRREQTLAGVGQWSTGSNPPRLILISDPVTKTSYVLEPHTKNARKSQMMSLESSTAGSEAAMKARADKMVAEAKARTAGDVGMTIKPMNAELQTEDLGTSVIQGVTAKGRRTTRTVPAGAIGNQRPLISTEEIWTSEELHTVVMSRHVDPQAGETVYTLTNIRRAEPDASLFTVPADYTVVDSGLEMKVRTNRRE